MARLKSTPEITRTITGGKKAGPRDCKQRLPRRRIRNPRMAIPAPKTALDESAGKRLNPIKRKQMEDRVHELEAEINRLEDAIAENEAALQTFVNAEETQRVTHELATTRTELQSRMAEWEQLGQALQT